MADGKLQIADLGFQISAAAEKWGKLKVGIEAEGQNAGQEY
jgi:hypothetical protein